MVDKLSELLDIFRDLMPDFSKKPAATGSETTFYDPACGSGPLLIRAAEAAPADVAIYGQEKEGTRWSRPHKLCPTQQGDRRN